MRSTWPNQSNLCFLINPIIFCPFKSLITFTHSHSQNWMTLVLLSFECHVGVVTSRKMEAM
jgi:hypothetical protein